MQTVGQRRKVVRIELTLVRENIGQALKCRLSQTRYQERQVTFEIKKRTQNMNASNSTAMACAEYKETPLTQAFKTLVYVLIILISIIGNSTVIYVVYRNIQERNMTNWSIANLAASDILITFTGMPNMITELYIPHWIFGSFVCKVVVYLQSVAVACSVLTLLAVTGDRYLCVVSPLRRRPGIDQAKYIVVVIWIISLSIMAPLISAQKAKAYPDGKYYCVEEWGPPFNPSQAPKDFTIILFTVMYLSPLLGMAFLYLRICQTLWKRKAPGEHINQTELQIQKSRKKVFHMLVTVTAVFAACWLPLWVFQFIMFFAPDAISCQRDIKAFYFVSLFLAHANSAINPFLYSFFNVSFRDGFKNVSRCLRTSLHLKSRNRVAPTSAAVITKLDTLKITAPTTNNKAHCNASYNNPAFKE